MMMIIKIIKIMIIIITMIIINEFLTLLNHKPPKCTASVLEFVWK